jgi:hypothetical protein
LISDIVERFSIHPCEFDIFNEQKPFRLTIVTRKSRNAGDKKDEDFVSNFGGHPSGNGINRIGPKPD